MPRSADLATFDNDRQQTQPITLPLVVHMCAHTFQVSLLGSESHSYLPNLTPDTSRKMYCLILDLTPGALIVKYCTIGGESKSHSSPFVQKSKTESTMARSLVPRPHPQRKERIWGHWC